MPGRKWTSGTNYRYGYENQESDDEVYGDDNLLAFEYRMADPRLGRFWSVDPLAYDFPWNSPYAFSENRVTNAIELEGLEAHDLNGGTGSVNHAAGEQGPQPQGGIVNGPYKDGATANSAVLSGAPVFLPEMGGSASPLVNIPILPNNMVKIDVDFSCHDSRNLQDYSGESIFDRLFNTGFYGTGTGGHGGFSNAKYTSNDLAEIIEAMGTLKINLSKQIMSPVPSGDGEGRKKAETTGQKKLHEGQGNTELAKPKIKVRNFGDTIITENYYGPSKTKFYLKEVNGSSVGPATEADKEQQDSQSPH